MNFNLFIAKKIGGKQQGRQKLSSLSNVIACVSVAISILVMFVAIAISEGFKHDIKESAVGFSGEILFVAPGEDITTDRYPIHSDFSFLSTLNSIDGVKSIDGVAYSPGMIKTDENVQGVYFKGVDSTYNLSFYKKYLVEGELPDFSGKKMSNDILISQRLAAMLGYEVGDDLVAYFIGSSVKVRKFHITGLYNVRLEEIDKTMTIIDIRQVQRLNGWDKTQVSCMEISLSARADIVKVENQIDEIVMSDTLDSDDSVVVKNISDIYPNIFDWLAILDLNVLIILVLMVAVAGFNMISGLLIILFEKISMIGLLKALGMRTKNICLIFIYRGSFIILKGMLAGNIIAVLFCFIQGRYKILSLNPSNYFVDHIPIYMEPMTALILNLGSFLLMMLIMTIPSLFISKIRPDKTIKMR